MQNICKNLPEIFKFTQSCESYRFAKICHYTLLTKNNVYNAENDTSMAKNNVRTTEKMCELPKTKFKQQKSCLNYRNNMSQLLTKHMNCRKLC